MLASWSSVGQLNGNIPLTKWGSYILPGAQCVYWGNPVAVQMCLLCCSLFPQKMSERSPKWWGSRSCSSHSLLSIPSYVINGHRKQLWAKFTPAVIPLTSELHPGWIFPPLCNEDFDGLFISWGHCFPRDYVLTGILWTHLAQIGGLFPSG